MRNRYICLSAATALFAMIGVVGLAVQSAALQVPPVPTDIPIVDQTNTLTAEQKAAIADKIANERKATGNEIAVVMIRSLEGDALEDYSLRVARTWGIGQKERNSGVLLLIVKDDRKLRIEVGYSLEGALTDIRSNQIIRDRILPAFQNDDYFGGIEAGVDGIALAVHDEVDPNLAEQPADMSWTGFPWEFILFIGFTVFSWLGSMLARTKSWWAGGVIGGGLGVASGLIIGSLLIGIVATLTLTFFGLLLDRAVSANYRSHARHGDAPSWWAGGPYIGGGRSSGGGFGGFGGGGFGGGGSSGSW